MVDVLKESIDFFSNPKLNNNDFRRENEKKLDEFNPIYITALKIDLVNLAKKAKSLEDLEIKNSMLSDNAQKISNIDSKKLPLKAQLLLTKIQDIAIKLQEHKKSMDTQQNLHFENLQFKRLPQAIK